MGLAPVSEQLTEIRRLREARTARATDTTRLLESKRTKKRKAKESAEGGPGSGRKSLDQKLKDYRKQTRDLDPNRTVRASTNPRTLKREGKEWGAKFAPSKGWGTPMKMSTEVAGIQGGVRMGSRDKGQTTGHGPRAGAGTAPFLPR